jgi:hypothetical protein
VRLLRVQGLTDIWKSPIAAGAYLIMPFPPEWAPYIPSNVYAFLHVISVFLLPHMMMGFWSLIRAPNWRQNLPMIVFPVMFLLLLGTIHLGLTRYRETFYPVCLIWAAIGWVKGTPGALLFAVYGILAMLAIPIALNRMGMF